MVRERPPGQKQSSGLNGQIRLSKIVLIGTSHRYQLVQRPGADAFEKLIRCILDRSSFGVIAEEMSVDALLESKASQSVCALVARLYGIPHIFCDPDRQMRDKIGIRQENDIRIAVEFSDDPSEQQISGLIRESHDRREQYWLDRIVDLNFWPALFVCGANHIDSVGKKIVARGLSVEVRATDWSPDQ